MLTATLETRRSRPAGARAALVWGTLFGAFWAASACSEGNPAASGEDVSNVPDGGVAALDGDAAQPNRGPPTAADGSESEDAGDGDASKNTGPPPLITVRSACEMRADKHCARLAECAGFRLRALYGKLELCRSRMAAACTAEALLEDTGHTTYTLLRCAQDSVDASCADVLANREPAACRPAGRRREGAGCAADSQCGSNFCALRAEGCGECQARQRLGQGCSLDAGCTEGLVCGVEGKCIKPGDLGAGCDERSAVCQAHLACLDGRCTTPLAAGAACASTGQCSPGDGLVCTTEGRAFVTAAGPVCRNAAMAAAGEICAIEGNTVAHCGGGPAACAKDAAGAFRCMPVAKDGEACGNRAQGAACEAGSRCLGGICRFGPVAGCGA